MGVKNQEKLIKALENRHYLVTELDGGLLVEKKSKLGNFTYNTKTKKDLSQANLIWFFALFIVGGIGLILYFVWYYWVISSRKEVLTLLEGFEA